MLSISSSPRVQLQKLILKPLEKVQQEPSPKIVIIDSLHECSNQADVISLLIEAARTPTHPILFFVTSLFDKSIDQAFKKASVLAPPIDLYNCDDVNDDIRLFFQSRFADLNEKRGIKESWHSDEDLDHLVILSSGLFIYAATVTKFIEGGRHRPRRRKEIVLKIGDPDGHKLKIYANLDRLYKQILGEIPKDEYSDHIGTLIGTITLVVHPLTLGDLDDLLQLQPGSARDALDLLHSLFVVPNLDNDVPVRLAHTLFGDFIADSERSGEFHRDTRSQHHDITHFCLKTIVKNLKRDTCNIGNPELLNSQVINPNIQQRCKTYINGALEYSCRHWTDHLSYAAFSDDLAADLREFGHQSLLHWIEALSLLGALDSALPALRAAQKSLKVSSIDNRSMVAL